MLTRLVGSLVLLGLQAGLPHAADWPRFRGPNGSGLMESNINVKFDLKTDVAWKRKLPGVGHGSPIVVGDRLFLQAFSRDGTQLSLVCLDAKSGDLQWSKGLECKAGRFHKKNSMASSTPCSDGEQVYTVFWDGTTLSLYAYDFKGTELWKKPLGSYNSEHGAGHSPMATDGLVIFNFDQDGAAELIAFDAKTGDQKWKTARSAHRASYTVPLVREIKGQPAELVVGSTTTIDGYDMKTGKPNWTYKLPWGDAGKPLRAVGQPLLVDDTIIMSTGEGGAGRYCVAVKPDEKGQATKIWDLKKGTPYVPGLAAFKEHLYWVGDDGLAGCAVAKTGEVLWNERVLARGVSSSPVLANDLLFIVGEDGNSATFKASPKGLDKVSSSSFGEAVFATPAAANGLLYVRGADHLFCIRAAAK